MLPLTRIHRPRRPGPLLLAGAAMLLLGAPLRPAGSASDPGAELAAEARSIVQQFAGSLKQALLTAIEQEGPVAAIEVCHEKAPAIAASLEQKHAWEIARTSLRTRNPGNRPDEWEKQVLKDFEARAAAGEQAAALHASIITESAGRREFRFMKAIPTEPLCLTCHGQAVAEPVREAIAELYPEDRATGYRVNEIRGAFTLRRPLPPTP